MRNGFIASFIVSVGVLATVLVVLAQPAVPMQKAQAQKPTIPDLSGDWNAGGGCGWNPDDPKCTKIEDGTPYQPWALAKVKSERTGYGATATFEDTTDPHMKYCDPMVAPRVYFNPSKFKFLQNNPDVVYIMYEYGPYFLPVSMNRKHPDDPDPSWWGDSIGWYEGDTFVIDTVGFNDKTWLDQMGRPHTDKLHVVQRFHRLDPEHLELDVTFDDPGAYTRSWSGKKIFTRSHTGFGRYMWVCTYLENHKFDDAVEKPTLPAAPPNR